MLFVKPYQSSTKTAWDSFIYDAKNATFLFYRDYMEYHADRFDDYSLVIYDDTKIVGLFPANRVGAVVYSHQGLSYGGLVTSSKTSLHTTGQLYITLLEFLKRNQITTVRLKLFPSFYASYASNEATYLMFVLKAKKVKCDVTLAIDQGAMVGFNKNKKRNVIAAKNKSLIIAESSDFCLFWKDVLEPNLKETHGIVPVHTYDEMGFLHRFYKDHIRLFTVFEENEIVAGAVLYISKQVAHVQYMSANEKGKKSAALDFLMNDLINVKYAHKKIFDFGVVNDGQGINWGLTYWKESFGAQAYCQDTYEIDTNSSVYLKELIG